MPQEITEEEQQLAAKEPTEDDLGEDRDAVPADQFDQTPKDSPVLQDKGDSEPILGDDLERLVLTQPSSETGEEV
jgi:hypothetical protein